MASTYDLIETTTLDTAASSVTFSSITQDYRDLVLVVDGKQTNTDASGLARFNGDSGSNYPQVGANGNGNSFASFTVTGTGSLAVRPGGYVSISQIMDYSATDKHKTVLARTNGTTTGADGVVEMRAIRWENTAAITQIDIVSDTQDFQTGATFSLYGISA
jgi:hypothetical protein